VTIFRKWVCELPIAIESHALFAAAPHDRARICKQVGRQTLDAAGIAFTNGGDPGVKLRRRE
jgi:hypothetical protein